MRHKKSIGELISKLFVFKINLELFSPVYCYRTLASRLVVLN
jgi:hypothetical protein